MDHSNHFSPRRAVSDICFGLDRPTDERSLAALLQRFTRRSLLAVLIPRMSGAEITATLDHVSALLRRHLSEKEYHNLFLNDRDI